MSSLEDQSAEMQANIERLQRDWTTNQATLTTIHDLDPNETNPSLQAQRAEVVALMNQIRNHLGESNRISFESVSLWWLLSPKSANDLASSSTSSPCTAVVDTSALTP